MPRTVVIANKDIIRANTVNGRREPALEVHYEDGTMRRCHRVQFLGPSEVIFDMDSPVKNRVAWMQTDFGILIDEECVDLTDQTILRNLSMSFLEKPPSKKFRVSKVVKTGAYTIYTVSDVWTGKQFLITRNCKCEPEWKDMEDVLLRVDESGKPVWKPGVCQQTQDAAPAELEELRY